MRLANQILREIKKKMQSTEPDAIVILFGSFARGDNDNDSDIDLLILLNKDKITREDEIKVKYPLYDIEFDTGQIISPIVISKKKWENRFRITPFYENIVREGIVL
jgi:predicted nucleotidyltransferase